MEKIGKYTIIEQIGVGGFGTVYLGEDPYLKRKVAVKTCTSDAEDIRKRFYREAEIAGNLRHRNIVTVHDFGVQDEVPFLVQEYLTGEDLKAMIKRRDEIADATKVDYLIQIATGLAYAHSKGVVHRDVKPGNMRVTEGGLVKIMDFGIAKLENVASHLTRTGMTLGTAAYLPPEQIRGAAVDHRADIFSFGVLAYELLTYKRPFSGKSISNLFTSIIYRDPVPVSARNESCPPELVHVVDTCLVKNPDERYQELAPVIADLERAADAIGRRRPSRKTTHALSATPDVAGDEEEDDGFDTTGAGLSGGTSPGEEAPGESAPGEDASPEPAVEPVGGRRSVAPAAGAGAPPGLAEGAAAASALTDASTIPASDLSEYLNAARAEEAATASPEPAQPGPPAAARRAEEPSSREPKPEATPGAASSAEPASPYESADPAAGRSQQPPREGEAAPPSEAPAARPPVSSLPPDPPPPPAPGLATTVRADEDAEINASLAKVRSLLASGELDGASALLGEVLEAAPRNQVALHLKERIEGRYRERLEAAYGRVAQLIDTGSLDEAEAALLEAARDDLDNTSIRDLRQRLADARGDERLREATEHRKRGELTAAIRVLDDVLADNPDHTGAAALRARYTAALSSRPQTRSRGIPVRRPVPPKPSLWRRVAVVGAIGAAALVAVALVWYAFSGGEPMDLEVGGPPVVEEPTDAVEPDAVDPTPPPRPVDEAGGEGAAADAVEPEPIAAEPEPVPEEPEAETYRSGDPGVTDATLESMPPAELPVDVADAEASVLLYVLVDETGAVEAIRTLPGGSSDPALVEVARATAEQATFTPAERGGVPGKQWSTLRVEFVAADDD